MINYVMIQESHFQNLIGCSILNKQLPATFYHFLQMSKKFMLCHLAC